MAPRPRAATTSHRGAVVTSKNPTAARHCRLPQTPLAVHPFLHSCGFPFQGTVLCSCSPLCSVTVSESVLVGRLEECSQVSQGPFPSLGLSGEWTEVWIWGKLTTKGKWPACHLLLGVCDIHRPIPVLLTSTAWLRWHLPCPSPVSLSSLCTLSSQEAGH